MVMISVIVPVYAVEKYLHECVQSILYQSFYDFELILVDDGSPDSCGEMCDEYSRLDPRVRVIHQENKGLSGARNSGIEISKGSYIAFVDSDDVLAPNYLEILYNVIKNKDTEIVACQCLDFVDGKMSFFPRCECGSDTDIVVYDYRTALLALYSGDPLVLIGAPAKLYKRELITNLRFPVGRLHEDQAFTPIALYKAKRITFVNAAAYYYRIRDNSITHNEFSLKRYDDIWAIDRCIAFFKEKNEPEIVEAAERKRKRLLAVYSICARRDGVTVPKEYRVGLLRALGYLRKNVNPMKYEYYLAQVSPFLVRVHVYEQKLKRMLRGEKK